MTETPENICNTYNIDMKTIDYTTLSKNDLLSIFRQVGEELAIRRKKEVGIKIPPKERCLGLNKRKEQCKRLICPSVGYCYYHKKQKDNAMSENEEEDAEYEENDEEDAEYEENEEDFEDEEDEDLYEFPRGTKYYDDFV